VLGRVKGSLRRLTAPLTRPAARGCRYRAGDGRQWGSGLKWWGLVRRGRGIWPEAGALAGLTARAGEHGQELQKQQLQQLKEEELRSRERRDGRGLDRIQHA
jgi:hypothetical protein